MKLIIDRARWNRGTGDQSALLIKDTQKMCCLGFYAIACGVSEENILGVPMPDDMDIDALPEAMKWLVIERDGIGYRVIASTASNNLAAINDNSELFEDTREREIAEIFAEHDVQVEFIN